MKFSPNLSRARTAGFTLVEIYSVMAIMTFLTVALIACQIFALKIYNLAATKLSATAAARNAINHIRDQIRAASSVRVGIYDPTVPSFTACASGTSQTGNAVAIYGTNASIGTIYYMDSVKSNLSSIIISNSTLQTATLHPNLVVWITNYYAFEVLDCSNQVMTTLTQNRIIHVKFLFAEWEFPLAGVGNGALYDYYQLQTRASMRVSGFQ